MVLARQLIAPKPSRAVLTREFVANAPLRIACVLQLVGNGWRAPPVETLQFGADQQSSGDNTLEPGADAMVRDASPIDKKKAPRPREAFVGQFSKSVSERP